MMKYEQLNVVSPYDRVKRQWRRRIMNNWYVDCDKDNIVSVEFHGKFFDIDINGDEPIITCCSGGNESICQYMKHVVLTGEV